VLRLEAIVHNTKTLGIGRVLDKFPQIVTRLAGMVDRFATTLDCADVGFLPDGILDQLPQPSQLGAVRVGGIDLNKSRIRAAMAAVLALAPAAPGGFTVAELAGKVRAMTGQTETGYTTRQATYDLRKLRGKQLVEKPARSRRYHVPDLVARTISGLLTLRDHVIGPILTGIRSTRHGPPPAHPTRIDHHYQTNRTTMQDLFHDLGISTTAATA
jgi:hypothetical protein